MRIFGLIALLAAPVLATPVFAADDPQTPLNDPYRTGMWDYQQVRLLGDPASIKFDARVVVRAPEAAEDAFEVPVLIDATAIPNVKKIVVSVDYGPIPKILTFHPGEAAAKLAFRFKIDQSTPVRASVMDSDGNWYVGGTEISAAGGGCTAPAQAYANADWADHLGEVRGRMWPETGRLRMIVDHPMDTGLADGIPIFIVENLAVEGPNGTMARLELHEPVDEDPAFTLFFAPGRLSHDVKVKGRDNNGNEIEATIPLPLTQ